MKQTRSWWRQNAVFIVLPLLFLALLILPSIFYEPGGSYPPLLRWNDTFYKDSGFKIASANLPENAQQIGTVESTLTLSERPTENLQANLPGLLGAEIYLLEDGNLAVYHDDAYWRYELLLED